MEPKVSLRVQVPGELRDETAAVLEEFGETRGLDDRGGLRFGGLEILIAVLIEFTDRVLIDIGKKILQLARKRKEPEPITIVITTENGKQFDIVIHAGMAEPGLVALLEQIAAAIKSATEETGQ